MTERISYHLTYTLGRPPAEADDPSVLIALSHAVRDALTDRILATQRRVRSAKHVAYVSMEFLIGRSLRNNLINLGLMGEAREACAAQDRDLEVLLNLEEDAALGNGGLGRLAACFLDSLATLDLPAVGYGLLYEHGLFRQEFHSGRQHERPDRWSAAQSPWVRARPEEEIQIPVYGRVSHEVAEGGAYNPVWMDWKLLVGIPFDLPIAGYGGSTVNVLRLFQARAAGDFDMRRFHHGDYLRAVEERVHAETVSKVLYPNDHSAAGRELRLVQEYFLCACAVRDVVRQCERAHGEVRALGRAWAIQLNDTHPALTVAELMRILVDEHAIPWDEAWQITTSVCAYTNHTLMPEALERWSLGLMEHVIPRHVQIILEINHRFLGEVERRWPGDDARKRRMSIIEEGQDQKVRMAHLAIVGGHAVNGVAAMHSELVKHELVPDFFELWPARFQNKTNGVTPRRWLLACNPGLASLLDRNVSGDWAKELDRLTQLERLADDRGLQADFEKVKYENKRRLAEVIRQLAGETVDPRAMFDTHIKRIHEYKRQLLNALDLLRTYDRIVHDGLVLPGPRVCVFAGKAAPGYDAAKDIIHFINALGRAINRDPRVQEQLKVVFLPDYRVSLAERIVPAADLSEQISTAGMEASGTGNMKMAINGAVTIGTMDGANVEIHGCVGDDNIFICGLTADEISRRKRSREPLAEVIARSDYARRVLELLRSSFIPAGEEVLTAVAERLLRTGDPYFVFSDLESYGHARTRAAQAFVDRSRWNRMAIINTARTGWFSSDRTIREYAEDIWGLTPVP
ncbi:MAG: glycogen/starch/alpha-glucan phosphorylase [Kofleriaceae bacterium]